MPRFQLPRFDRPSQIRNKRRPDIVNGCVNGHIPDSASSQKLLDSGKIKKQDQNGKRLNHEADYFIKDFETSGCQAKIYEGTEDEVAITGYKLVRWRWLLVTFGMVLTGGLLWLFLYWIPRRKLQLTHRIATLEEADTILVEEQYKKDYSRFYVKKVYTEEPRPDGVKFTLPVIDSPTFQDVSSYRYFHLKKETFLWNPEIKIFYPLHGVEIGATGGYFHKQAGLSREEQNRRRLVYGPNDILVPFNSVLYLLVKEVLNPFYIFQVFSVCLWFSDEYYYYAATIVILSTGGVVLSIYQTRKNQKKLRSAVQSTDIVSVMRSPDLEESVSSADLVPGDVVVIPPGGCELNFDGVLISGTAIVNEAMLTGESVPETKTAIPRSNLDEMFQPREHIRHTLFRGTRVIQTRNYAGHKVLAVVLRTGFNTTKGKLVRSIMYPAPVDFKFEKDSYKFVGLLTVIAGIGFIYTCVRLVMAGSSARDIFLDAADLITIVVPPALPAAMTIGSLYAQDRLQKQGIYCISPRTINVSGSIDCVCFDKTGTLTEDGLDLLGIVPVTKVSTEDPSNDKIRLENLITDPKTLSESSEMIQCMASCHSVTILDHKLSGDPMDVIMFTATGWQLDEQSGEENSQFDSIAPTVVRPSNKESVESPENNDSSFIELSFDHEIGIIRQFQFTSERQCMSVVVRMVRASHFTIFCKGSPEKIKSISKPETLPVDFETTLVRYTERGYRVIALAKRDLQENMNYRKIQRMERSDSEKDLTFLGLIILENRIKKQTKPTIQELHNARIRTIMVTGDHIQTALSVAKECKMIPPSDKVIFITASEDDDGTPDIKFHLHRNTGSNNNSLAQMNGAVKGSDFVVEIDRPNSNSNPGTNYHFAITGKSFNIVKDHYPDVMEKLCTRGAIFARMSPDQKETLVAGLQGLGYYVAMCGDGANDCGALKAAHAGISLSEAEASVASPFTCKEANISCIPRLIREGRCALVTSFGIFKYMAAYSLTQFVSVMILYNFGTNLSDVQFLYIDLFLITVFASCFGMTKPYEGELAKQPPSNSLISFVPVSSLILQLAAVIAFQVLGLTTIQAQSEWFVSFDKTNPTYINTTAEEHYNSTFQDVSEYACWENYAIFTVSSFQYIILAYAFSKSAPYRKQVFTNIALLTTLCGMTVFTIFAVFWPSSLVKSSLELFLPPKDFESFRWTLLAIICSNILACIVLEDFVVEILFRKLQAWCRRSSSSKPQYVKLNDWMRKTPSWPPLSVEMKSSEDESDEDTEPSPIETQVAFEVVDEDEAFWKLFPTKPALLSEDSTNCVNSSSAAAALNPPTSIAS